MDPHLPPIFEGAVIKDDIGRQGQGQADQELAAEGGSNRTIRRDETLGGQVDDRRQPADQEGEQDQARLSDRAVDRKLLLVHRPALRQHHQHPDAGGDAMGVELPWNGFLRGEIARPEARDDHCDAGQHIIRRIAIWHGKPPLRCPAA